MKCTPWYWGSLTMAYFQDLSVRFEDVDYAQVVFFPRILGYCHHVFEDFFEKEMGVAYPVMVKERKVGFPAVHAEADFRSPLHYGQPLRVEMAVLAMGKSSLTCRYRFFAKGSDSVLAEAKVVTAAIALDRFRSAPMPDDVRAAFARHLVK